MSYWSLLCSEETFPFLPQNRCIWAHLKLSWEWIINKIRCIYCRTFNGLNWSELSPYVLSLWPNHKTRGHQSWRFKETWGPRTVAMQITRWPIWNEDWIDLFLLSDLSSGSVSHQIDPLEPCKELCLMACICHPRTPSERREAEKGKIT